MRIEYNYGCYGPSIKINNISLENHDYPEIREILHKIVDDVPTSELNRFLVAVLESDVYTHDAIVYDNEDCEQCGESGYKQTWDIEDNTIPSESPIQ